MHLRQEVQERSKLQEACSKIPLFKQVQCVEDCQIDDLSNCCYEAQAKPSNSTIVFKAAVPYLWKRMRAAREAKGELFAFLDDDTYVDSDYLEKGKRHFEDAKIMVMDCALKGNF